MLRVSLRLGMSKVMVSPSRTAAMGPPSWASGATWPAMRPRVAPEKRPSVRSATVSLKLGDALDGGGDGEHLAHAGAAARAFVADDEHVVGVDLAVLRRRRRRPASRSKTRAVPVWLRRSWPATLMTQPSGARLPRRMTRPPVGLSGLSQLWMTTWPGVSTAVSASAKRVLPLTVGMSFNEPCSFERAWRADASRRLPGSPSRRTCRRARGRR